MPYFPFNSNVPNAPDNAADDQPDMLIDTQSTNAILDVDHYTFNGVNDANNLGGYHKKMTLLNAETPKTVPSFGESAYFLAKNKNSDSWPAWFNSTNTTSNAAITFMTGRNERHKNGYVYLPGGLLMQWGFISKITPGEPFGDDFLVEFIDDSYIVQLQAASSNAIAGTTYSAVVRKKTKKNFTFSLGFNNVNLKGLLWTAIGKINA